MRNSTIISTFIRSLYKGIIGCLYRVFYMVSMRFLAFAIRDIIAVTSGCP